MTIYFSNRLEILFSHLQENLFADTSTVGTGGIFAKRLLIVPASSVDTWIRLRMAHDPKFKIATGFKTLFLNNALNYLCQQPATTHLEWVFRIERQVRNILENEALDVVWEPLISYLASHEERLIPLCSALSVHFTRYALYGRHVETKLENWQKRLWQKVFPENPYAKLLKSKSDFTGSIHLFGFNHLSDFHFTFFQQLSSQATVSIYHLSPCKEFWSDIKADREIGSFLKSKKLKIEVRAHLEELLADQNRILANLGAVHRDFAYKVENSGFDTVEDYYVEDSATALAKMQREILLLEKAEGAAEDDSIQQHVFPTKYREIEGLYHHITRLLSQRNGKVGTILVFAPDINLYAPYIRAVFEDTFNYRIEHFLIRGLFLLLDLEKKRWSSDALLEILAHPQFLEKWDLNQDDLKKIEKWIQYGQIRWGYNREHAEKLVRQRNVDADLEDGHSTWRSGLDRLLCSMAYSNEIAFTESELLQRVIILLDRLYTTLTAIQGTAKKTMALWCEQILNLALDFFVCKEAELKDLENVLEELKMASTVTENSFTLHEFLHFFKKLTEDVKSTEKSGALETVQFCSLMPMEALPAADICLIGMNLDVFPRRSKGAYLDLLKKEKGNDFAPTPTDLDKALFLEILLSARDSLYISTSGEMPPSNVVDMLEIKKCVKHPLFSFDHRYFTSSENGLQGTSRNDFNMAVASYAPKKSPHLLIGNPEGLMPPKGKHYIDVKELLRCFTNPLKLYFREHLNVKFWKEKESKEEEEFVLSYPNIAELRRDSLKNSNKVLVENALKKGKFPLHAFKEVAHIKIADEIEALHNALKAAKLGGRDLKKYHLEPFLNLELAATTHVVLTGELEGVTQEGLFIFERCQMAKAARHLPSFLILNHIRRANLIFGKDGKTHLPFFEDPSPLLKTCLEYYFVCHSAPSFLFPDWIEPILQQDVKKLAKVMAQKSFAEELKFASRNQMVPGPEQIIQIWGNWAERLYGGMKQGWF